MVSLPSRPRRPRLRPSPAALLHPRAHATQPAPPPRPAVGACASRHGGAAGALRQWQRQAGARRRRPSGCSASRPGLAAAAACCRAPPAAAAGSRLRRRAIAVPPTPSALTRLHPPPPRAPFSQPVVDLLHPDPKKEKRLHKKKRLVQVRARPAPIAAGAARALWAATHTAASRARPCLLRQQQPHRAARLPAPSLPPRVSLADPPARLLPARPSTCRLACPVVCPPAAPACLPARLLPLPPAPAFAVAEQLLHGRALPVVLPDHDRLLARDDRRRVRPVRAHAVPADGRQVPPDGGLLLPQEGRVGLASRRMALV